MNTFVNDLLLNKYINRVIRKRTKESCGRGDSFVASNLGDLVLKCMLGNRV